jgi:hypothetical protein
VSERTDREPTAQPANAAEGHESTPVVAAQRSAPAAEVAPGSDLRAPGHVPEVSAAAERSSGDGPEERSDSVATAAGVTDDSDDFDLPLPDLPPLPADPRWRIEHMALVMAAGFALVFCAASVGFLVGGMAAALGAGAGVLVVTIGYSITTLSIAWADAVRPALVMPVGLAAYVIKFLLIAFIMSAVAVNGWAGGIPMAWGIAAGAVLLTAVQVWWISRLARRNFPAGGLGRS